MPHTTNQNIEFSQFHGGDLVPKDICETLCRANFISSTNDTVTPFYNRHLLVTNISRLNPEDICGLKYAITFQSLFKSTCLSVLSLSLAQFKTNLIQHELATSKLQKYLLYFPACILNTLSHLSLLTLFSILYFQLSQTFRYMSYFSTPIFFLLIFLIKVTVNVVVHLLTDSNLMQNNIDQLKFEGRYSEFKFPKCNPKFYYTLGCLTTFNISWQCIYSIDFQKNGGGSYRVKYQSIGGAYADAPSMLGTPDYT